MGALTAAKLSNFIVQALRPLTLLIHFWSDSRITLHWIKGQKRADTFVTHRVTDILNLSRPDHWQHCPTQDNPADLLTSHLNLGRPRCGVRDLNGYLFRTVGPLRTFRLTLRCRHWQSPQPVLFHQIINSHQVLYTSALLLTLPSIASCTDSWQLLHTCIDLLTTLRSFYQRE